MFNNTQTFQSTGPLFLGAKGGEKTKYNKKVRLCVDDPIPAVLSTQVDWKWCWGRGKLEALVMKTTHMSNVILNHSGVFACQVRFILRGGEDYKVRKSKLVGFYKMDLDIV